MQSEGLAHDSITFILILKACCNIGLVEQGEIRRGFLENDIVLGITLVHMYAKRGALEKAQQVLEVLFTRDTSRRNVVITRMH